MARVLPNVKLNDLYHRTRSDSIDPFTHDLNPGFKNVIQIIFMSITLAPLRLMCIVFLLFTALAKEYSIKPDEGGICWIIYMIPGEKDHQGCQSDFRVSQTSYPLLKPAL